MTTIRISEVVHRWLGWCPRAQVPVRKQRMLNDTPVENSRAQGGRIPSQTVLKQRYRNQVLIWAVFFTMVSLPLIWIFQSADLTRLMLGIGVITGLGVFVFFGRWMWNSLMMLRKGATIKTRPKEYILTFLIAGAIPIGAVLVIAAMLFLIPLARALAFPAFATGFAFIPWYVVFLILLWERKTGYRVMFDKETGEFSAAKGADEVHR
ncbi:MAG TPA: DUF1673 family protein [Methanoregulaceae archaeon]|nr:DUF1673 family protein [Methanoregulaceae archaeon]